MCQQKLHLDLGLHTLSDDIAPAGQRQVERRLQQLDRREVAGNVHEHPVVDLDHVEAKLRQSRQ
jgi:hypothetical protein